MPRYIAIWLDVTLEHHHNMAYLWHTYGVIWHNMAYVWLTYGIRMALQASAQKVMVNWVVKSNLFSSISFKMKKKSTQKLT